MTIASKRAGFALACAFALLSSAAAGQTSGVATPDPAAPPVDQLAVPGAYRDAPVTVFNRTIVVFKGPVFGNSPAERATHAQKRIVTLLERRGPGVVSIETVPQGKLVKIDGVFALGITPADLDAMAGETLDGVTADTVQALERVIAETREVRDLKGVLRASGLAAAATAVYLALLWMAARVRRWVGGRLMRYAQTNAERLRLGGVAILEGERTLAIVRRALTAAFWAIVLLLSYEWLGLVLGYFPYTRPWAEQLNQFLLGVGGMLLANTARALPDLFIAAVIFVIARYIAGFLNRFFDRVQSGHYQIGWLDEDTARPTRRVAIVVVWLFGLAMAYPYFPGADTDAFKGLSVLIGLMVSIGGASVVGQAASGLILMFARTLRPGENVRIGDHEGTVVSLGTFTTRIRTGLGEELTLPNALIVASVTKNYSRLVEGQGFVVDAPVTIGYDTPWRQVHAMLVESALRTRGVQSVPAPRVHQTGLADFYVEYRLVCQTTPAEPRPRAEVLSELHANIQDVFNENGVQIMSPHYLGDPAEAKIVPKARWYAVPVGKSRGSPG